MYMRCPRGVMVKTVDKSIVMSEFELKSRIYVQVWTNAIGKVMNPLILPAMS